MKAAWRRVAGSDRPLMVAALTVRVAGLAMIAYAVPISWPFEPHRGWSLLVVLTLIGGAAATVWLWLRAGRVGPATLAIELPVGLVAIVATSLLAEPGGHRGFTGYTYSYTVLVALILGLSTRTWLGTIAAGLVWAAASTASATLIEHHPLWTTAPAVPSYLVNPVVGFACARLLRRGTIALDTARQRALTRAAELSTERERQRHAAAMHDRVLQTLETLARPGAVTQPVLADRIGTEAAWLRRFVESGVADQQDDLASALAAAARAVGRVGVSVQLHDAALRTEEATVLPEPVREALIDALHQTLIALGGGPAPVRANLVVRGVPDRGGVLLTVLATEPGSPADLDEIALARTRLAEAGGELVVEQVPYAELWVPGPTVTPTSST